MARQDPKGCCFAYAYRIFDSTTDEVAFKETQKKEKIAALCLCRKEGTRSQKTTGGIARATFLRQRQLWKTGQGYFL